MPMDDHMSRKEQRRGTRRLLLWSIALWISMLFVTLVLSGVLSFTGRQSEARSPPAMSAPSAPPITAGRR
jgi:hypothetical protein